MPDQVGISLARRLTLALGVHQLLAWATTFYVPAVILREVTKDLGTTPAALLAGFSGALLVAGGCAPLVGTWIGRVGGRRPMGCGALLLGVGLILLAVSPGLAVWWLGWAVLGLGMALSLYDAAFATVGVALGSTASATITGVALIGGFASTLGWPVGSALLHHLGWRGLLLVYAGLHLAISLPLIVLTLPSGAPAAARCPTSDLVDRRGHNLQLACMSGFFALRWFITSAIAAQVLLLMSGLGLGPAQAMAAAMLIGPGQVAGRLLDWFAARHLDPLSRARVGALLFPIGALLLLSGMPDAAFGFALLYGMSNGILTVNRGTLPMLVLGSQGYAARLGQIALPVMLAQAVAPTLAAPLIAGIAGPELLLLAGAVAGVSALLLLPLRARLV
ncbi:MFS transporter [Roseomonas nepalensis]|uniref:MFS transporter n=1 Tax=Muricoccus nepalensis TaxID=1854500 RepID=A0A502FS63_9PROT|nr:MFS transporter [Roseomonas nepalensis]TPG52284.1 MFS transporter [Roseomonas nepalensis]